MTINYRKF